MEEIVPTEIVNQTKALKEMRTSMDKLSKAIDALNFTLVEIGRLIKEKKETAD